MKEYFDIVNGELILYCGKNENVIVPNDVIKINENAFRYFNNLKSIIINDNVKEICDSAFYECYSLEEIILPNNLEKIGSYVFDECCNLKFNIYENGKYLGSKDNPYFLFYGALNTEISLCTIHNETKFIYDLAFSKCHNLVSIIIPNSVIGIGECVFLNCSNLKEVTIGKNLVHLKNETFLNCFKLESVIFLSELKTIGYCAFKNCTSLNNLVLPNTLTEIGYNAFSNCKNLKSITIPNKIEILGKDVFLNFDNLEICFYGDKIRECLKDIFSKEKISIYAPNISLKDSQKNRQKFINGYLNNFKGNETVNEIVLKDYVKYIKTNKTRFFQYIDENLCYFLMKNNILNLYDIDLLINLTTNKNQIELTAKLLEYKNKKYTFEEIEENFEKSLLNDKKVSLTSLKPLWEIKKLDNGNYEILGYKGNETEIEIPSKVSNGVIEKISLNGKSSGITQESAKNIRIIKIPNTVKSIGGRAFDNCLNLTNIFFYSGIEELGNYAFCGSNKLSYNIYKNASYLGSIDNPYFIFIEVIDKNIETCEINPNTKFIYSSAFQDCKELNELKIPESVISVGASAFKNCSKLKRIIFNNGIDKIGEFAFKNCSSLKNIVLPDTIGKICMGAFSGCKNLEEIKLPENLNTINIMIFNGCKNLSRIYLPNGLKKIRDAFSGCENLKEIYYNGSELDFIKIEINDSVRELISAKINYFC